jgi:peptide/nickel transport system ATP-binding protein
MYAGRIVETGPVDDVIARSLHPYTLGLMGSIPRLRDARARLAQIDGSMPRLDAMPPGCAFHPRCGHAGPRCAVERPEPASIGASRVACLLHSGGVGAEGVGHG